MRKKREPRVVVDYLRLAAEYLAGRGIGTARLDAEVLLSDVLATERISLYVNFDRPLDGEEVARYREALRRRGRGEPVAYITGRRAFRTLTLAVNRDVLIPRPETELLVEAVLERLPGADAPEPTEAGGAATEAGGAVTEAGGAVTEAGGAVTAAGGAVTEAGGAMTGRKAGGGPLRVADVGTGSGAIAVALAAARPDAAFVALDVSEAALTVAKANAAACGVAERIRFVHGDLLAPLLAETEGDGAEILDAVVANPPYVPSGAWEELAEDVKAFEPRLALDGGPDGLDLYRRLIPQAAAALKPGGLLALEIGSDQGGAVQGLLADGPWRDVGVLPDYAGHDRIVVATKGT